MTGMKYTIMVTAKALLLHDAIGNESEDRGEYVVNMTISFPILAFKDGIFPSNQQFKFLKVLGEQ